ncbi:hypothetical protein Tco_1446690 [Tanacetum coccineum]
MWSSTRTIAPTLTFDSIQLPLTNNFHTKADFLQISNLFQYGKNLEEAVMLRTFPFSLSGAAKTCFHQLDNESLFDAWLRMKELLRTCYRHGLTKGTITQTFYRGLDDPTQGILYAGGIFLYKNPNEVFKILEDKVLLKPDFSEESQNSPNPKTVVSVGESKIKSSHELLSKKFEALATKIDSEFLKIRKELKEMRDGHRNNHASQIYMSDDTPMCDLMESNYEMMKEWMARQTEANKDTKNQEDEWERQIIQGLRNHQAIIQNLERYEIVYKPPSIRNDNDKGDVEFVEEDEIKPIPTMPNPNPIMSNSLNMFPFLNDSIVHSPYTNAKTFTDDVLLNNVGEKELKSTDGVGTGRMTKKEIKKDDNGVPKELKKKWKLKDKVVPHKESVYHYLWHPTEIPHLSHIIKES